MDIMTKMSWFHRRKPDLSENKVANMPKEVKDLMISYANTYCKVRRAHPAGATVTVDCT